MVSGGWNGCVVRLAAWRRLPVISYSRLQSDVDGLRLRAYTTLYQERRLRVQTAKQRILQAVESLPENATLEDAIERLCFLAKVEEGLRQSDAGETVSHKDAVRQLLG